MIDAIRKFILQFDARRGFFCSLKGEHRLLDAGCGRGKNAIEINVIHPTIEIHGVDALDEKQVPVFVHYKLVNLDEGVLPNSDQSFDAIILAPILEHLHFPLKLGREIHRILKKGGRVYLETPNWTSVLVPSFGFKRDQVGAFNFYDDHTHVKPWSKQGIFSFLQVSRRLYVEKVGTVRNVLRLPFDLIVIVWGLLTGNGGVIALAIWNLVGWRIYGIARRTEAPTPMKSLPA
jgi:SAM-dependent methyltransferase